MAKPGNIIAQIYKNVKTHKWECLHNDCKTLAINTHLGQRNGILSQLIENGHLIQLKVTDPHKWNKQSPIEFKRIGNKQAISLPVFCNTHDTSIFKPIESENTNIVSYESFLLFSYRTISAEIRKKEIALEQNYRVLRSNTLEGLIDKDRIQSYAWGLEFGIRDLSILKSKINDEILNNQSKFSFWSIRTVKFEIFASAVMSIFQVGHKSAEEYEFENLYIHVIPRNNHSIILVGYHNDYSTKEMKVYCQSWLNASQEDIEYKLTNLLTNHVENWVMTPSFFDGLTKVKKNKYMNYGLPRNSGQ